MTLAELDVVALVLLALCVPVVAAAALVGVLHWLCYTRPRKGRGDQ